MNQNELQMGGQKIQSKGRSGGRWLGAALALVAAASIAIVVRYTAVTAPPASNPAKPVAQSVADAARRDEPARIRAEGIPVGQIVPEAAQQGVNSYLNAHASANSADQGVNSYTRAHDDPAYHAPASADQSFRTPQTSDYHYVPTLGQVVPDASTQGVMDYLHGHGAGLPARGQVVPEAAMQGVMDYLHGHGAGLPAQHQAVPDAAQQGVDGYIAAHSAAADPSFRTPQTSDYQYVPTVGPDAADRTMLHDLGWLGNSQASSGQAVPDAATQGVLSYLRAHGAAVSTR